MNSSVFFSLIWLDLLMIIERYTNMYSCKSFFFFFFILISAFSRSDFLKSEIKRILPEASPQILGSGFTWLSCAGISSGDW